MISIGCDVGILRDDKYKYKVGKVIAMYKKGNLIDVIYVVQIYGEKRILKLEEYELERITVSHEILER